jgi:hypothetical protein
MLVVVEQPARAADPRLPVRVAAWLVSVPERARGIACKVDSITNLPTGAPPLPEAASLAIKLPTSRDEDLSPTRTAIRDDRVAVEVPAAPTSKLERAKSQSSKATTFPGDFTTCAGLFFLIPVLERLGFAEFLAAYPQLIECKFAAMLLRFIGARIGLRTLDPIALVIGECDLAAPALLIWDLPRPAREILATPAPRVRLDSLFASWLTAARRWCRRKARIGLASLVRRSGYVAASRTQLDVVFDLATVDLRVRRCALDVDPGWVPWLGLVVRFQYLNSHEFTG